MNDKAYLEFKGVSIFTKFVFTSWLLSIEVNWVFVASLLNSSPPFVLIYSLSAIKFCDIVIKLLFVALLSRISAYDVFDDFDNITINEPTEDEILFIHVGNL